MRCQHCGWRKGNFEVTSNKAFLERGLGSLTGTWAIAAQELIKSYKTQGSTLYVCNKCFLAGGGRQRDAARLLRSRGIRGANAQFPRVAMFASASAEDLITGLRIPAHRCFGCGGNGKLRTSVHIGGPFYDWCGVYGVQLKTGKRELPLSRCQKCKNDNSIFHPRERYLSRKQLDGLGGGAELFTVSFDFDGDEINPFKEELWKTNWPVGVSLK